MEVEEEGEKEKHFPVSSHLFVEGFSLIHQLCHPSRLQGNLLVPQHQRSLGLGEWILGMVLEALLAKSRVQSSRTLAQIQSLKDGSSV